MHADPSSLRFVRMTRAARRGGEPWPGGTKPCHEKHIAYRPATVPFYTGIPCHVDPASGGRDICTFAMER
ncbi:MAG TPA: hypothetical protein PLW67_01650 [Prolixibacteraceae bacterium]|nr:hypothetical protein [Prolixibacteraceae bacterium]